MAVARQFRARGVGKALVDKALKRLRDCRIDKCHIMVYCGNDQARAFWSRLGWVWRNDVELMSYDLKQNKQLD